LPSSRGTFVLHRDRSEFHLCAAVTWLSDERMDDDCGRLAAVRDARFERGFVVNHLPTFPVLSDERMKLLEGTTLEVASAAALNRLVDLFFDGESEPPEDWRFQEPDDIPRAADWQPVA